MIISRGSILGLVLISLLLAHRLLQSAMIILPITRHHLIQQPARIREL